MDFAYSKMLAIPADSLKSKMPSLPVMSISNTIAF
jgi:hypothetical protein